MGVRVVKMHQIQNLVWLFCRDPVSHWWVAHCDALGLTAAGKTFDEMAAEISVAMDALFRILLREGEIHAFLEARGWKPVTAPLKRTSRVKFDIPYTTKQASSASLCA